MKTDPIQEYDLAVACRLLGRVRARLFTVELATSRKRSPGRETAITDAALDMWDAGELEACRRAGVDILAISDAVETRADELIAAWTTAPPNPAF